MEKQTIKDRFTPNLFWDIRLSDLDMEQHHAFIVERVLERGTWEDWLLIRDYYGLEKIKEAAIRIRGMYPETLSFVALMTHTPENQFRCYTQLQSKNRPWYF